VNAIVHWLYAIQKAPFLTFFSRQLLSFTPFSTDQSKGLEVS